MIARCISIHATGVRCARPVCRASGNVYVCDLHARLITMALLDDMLAPATRRMLAYADWSTARAGQALINKMYKREAA